VSFDRSFGWFAPTPWLRRYGPLKLVRGSLLDRVALHYYTLSASIGAFMGGAMSLGTVVLKKTLHASELQMGLMMAIGPTTLLLGIIGSEFVMGRDKRPFILLAGMISRGAFLLFFLCTSPWMYIGLATVFSVFNSLMIPATSTLWQSTVSPQARNELWGLTISITTAISMATAFLGARLMDYDPMAYKWFFPVAAVLGMLSILIIARMPVRGRYKLTRKRPKISWAKVFVEPVRKMNKLMREDRNYRDFESFFFLYGVAFMIMAPVLPHYLVDVAKMNYTQAGLCDGVLFAFGMVALTSSWGRLMDRQNPMRLCALVFTILASFPALLLVGPLLAKLGLNLVYIVFLGYLIYGIGMSGLGVAWNLAPIAFAGERDASRYTGAHITITGIRGSIAPIVGALAMQHWGYEPVLAASALFFLIGAAGMVGLSRRVQREKDAATAAATDTADTAREPEALTGA